jgi:hypothetical protein
MQAHIALNITSYVALFYYIILCVIFDYMILCVTL